MNIGRLTIKAQRWPWMPCKNHWSHFGETPAKYGWGKVPGMARFGGGWDWKFGVCIGSSEVILDLIFGTVRISWGTK